LTVMRNDGQIVSKYRKQKGRRKDRGVEATAESRVEKWGLESGPPRGVMRIPHGTGEPLREWRGRRGRTMAEDHSGAGGAGLAEGWRDERQFEMSKKRGRDCP